MIQKTILCNESLVGVRNEKKAAELIESIQSMQYKLYGKSFRYWQFNGNTVAELMALKFDLLDEVREGNQPFAPNAVKF